MPPTSAPKAAGTVVKLWPGFRFFHQKLSLLGPSRHTYRLRSSAMPYSTSHAPECSIWKKNTSPLSGSRTMPMGRYSLVDQESQLP